MKMIVELAWNSDSPRKLNIAALQRALEKTGEFTFPIDVRDTNMCIQTGEHGDTLVVLQDVSDATRSYTFNVSERQRNNTRSRSLKSWLSEIAKPWRTQ